MNELANSSSDIVCVPFDQKVVVELPDEPLLPPLTVYVAVIVAAVFPA